MPRWRRLDPRRWRRWTQAAPWLGWGAAVALVAVQAFAVQHWLPLEDRWFLHSDDASTYVWAKEIWDHGEPAVAYDAQPFANVSEWHVLAGRNSEVDGGELRSAHAPGYLYLMAPFAAASPTALFAAVAAVAAGSLLLVFGAIRRMVGTLPALVALAAFAFSGPALFWSPFPRSNLAAVGLVFGGLWLLLSPRVGVRCAGVAVLAASVLVRYDTAILLAPLLAGWVIWNWPALRRRDRAVLLPVATAAASVLVLVGLLYLLYGTFDVVALAIGGETGETGAAGQIAATTSTDVLRDSTAQFLPYVGVHVLLGATLVLRRPAASTWPLPFLAIGALGLAAFVLTHEAAQQTADLYYSQTRYLLPVMAAGSLGLAWLVKSVRPLPAGLAGGLLVAGLLAATGIAAAGGAPGFGTAEGILEEGARHQAAADALDERHVFLGDFMATTVVDRPVLAFRPIPEGERREEVLAIVDRLLGDGYVPVVSTSFDFTYWAWIKTDSRFELVPIEGYPLSAVQRAS